MVCSLGKWSVLCTLAEVWELWSKKPVQTLVGVGLLAHGRHEKVLPWENVFFHNFCFGCWCAWEMNFQLQITLTISLHAHCDLCRFGLGSCSFHLSLCPCVYPPCLSLSWFLLFSVFLGLFFPGLFCFLSFPLTPLKGSSGVKFFQLWFSNGPWLAHWEGGPLMSYKLTRLLIYGFKFKASDVCCPVTVV